MKKNAAAENGTQPHSPPDLKTTYQHINTIGPRYQWEANSGYCGEVSMISAGLYYGQYLSQYDVRTLAWASQGDKSRRNTKNKQQSIQLLLGVNDAQVAKKLKLDVALCEVNDSVAFLKWVKKNVLRGYPVIIGVFNNEVLVYPTEHQQGDPEYDHIVPVMAWGSARPLDQDDISGDVILLSDNGLYGPDISPVPDSEVAYYYSYCVSCSTANPCFLADRQQANADPNRVYSLLNLPEKQNPPYKNYAIAVKGVLDKYGETLPIKLTTSNNYESPAIVDGSSARPLSEPVTLTVTVSGLTPGQTYNLYHYQDEKDVPVKNFNAESGDAWQVIEATADTWTGSLTIQSSDKAFFRAVNKNAD